MSSSHLPAFPRAQQAPIIRSNQRDIYYVASLREQAENVLRSWLGTRWLTRWDKEVELSAKLVYYGLTTGRAIQTLGEEYTNIWQHSDIQHGTPSLTTRTALVLFPTLPTYLLARLGPRLSESSSRFTKFLHKLPVILEVLTEINLAAFYFRGTYHDIVRRLLGVRNISSIPDDPNTRPPSYSLLGILLTIRLVYRLTKAVQGLIPSVSGDHVQSEKSIGKQAVPAAQEADTTIDGVSLSIILSSVQDDSAPTIPAEEDERTALDFASVPNELRSGRNCTLCLEERTGTCSTECGHLFCWTCIVGWGRGKAECPLCRQTLNLQRLIPIYNL
ncbi:hypothetical protein BD410DRAFT_781435 [Rickenella mellea]|uniref:RING-type E3 ubiquitin transferase n=1 Tax=Rickenella mellea TaxID=50990 RepID=A0A4Y7QNN0_9AGAM|nr:hypothetical protein BD410DRAFT_781435 [Rickenella mellea]